jgi:hypothetical protein
MHSKYFIDEENQLHPEHLPTYVELSLSRVKGPNGKPALDFYDSAVEISKAENFFVLYVPSRSASPRPSAPFSSVTQPFSNATGFPPTIRNETLWDGHYANQPFVIVQQLWPFAHNHFLLLPDPHTQQPQIIREKDIFLVASLVLHDPTQQLRGAFNSLTSGASKNELHIQGFSCKNHQLPIEVAPMHAIYNTSHNTIFELDDYPAHALVFQHANPAALAHNAYQFIENLQNENVAHVLLIAPQKIYIAPVNNNYITSFGNTWGFSELIGNVIIVNATRFLNNYYGKAAANFTHNGEINNCPLNTLNIITPEDMSTLISKEMQNVSVNVTFWATIKVKFLNSLEQSNNNINRFYPPIPQPSSASHGPMPWFSFKWLFNKNPAFFTSTNSTDIMNTEYNKELNASKSMPVSYALRSPFEGIDGQIQIVKLALHLGMKILNSFSIKTDGKKNHDQRKTVDYIEANRRLENMAQHLQQLKNYIPENNYSLSFSWDEHLLSIEEIQQQCAKFGYITDWELREMADDIHEFEEALRIEHYAHSIKLPVNTSRRNLSPSFSQQIDQFGMFADFTRYTTNAHLHFEQVDQVANRSAY